MRVANQRAAEFLRRVQWRNLAAVAAVLLVLGGILWVTISREYWTSALILVGAAVPLAILSLERSP